MVWVFPVFLLDGCFNRDPFLKVNDHFYIGASWPGAPIYLDYTNWSLKGSEEAAEEMYGEERTKAFESFRKKKHWQLDDITQFSLSETVIIGNSPKGWFIADLASGELKLFSSISGRDQVLRDIYHLDPVHSFGPPSWLMQVKSNFLWPWVHLYYAACLVLVTLLTLRESRRAPRRAVRAP